VALDADAAVRLDVAVPADAPPAPGASVRLEVDARRLIVFPT
jgi:hypothetical protein